jgi:hypothetical protein
MSFDLDVDGNISESPRTGVVTVVYDDSSSINITVNQEAITIQWNSQPIENLRNEGGI